MSKGFNLTAQLNLVGPTNVKQIAAQIKKDLGNVNATVNFKLDPTATKNVTALTSALQKLNSTLSATNKSASSAASALKMLGQSVNSVKLNNIPQQVNNISKSVSSLNNNAAKAKSSFSGVTNEMEDFGKQAGLAVRRFTAFATVTSVIYGLTNSINKGVQAFIEYDKELVRLQQVTGQSLKGLTQLQSRITDLSTSLGVSSKELTTVAVTLAQAGLSAKDTERSLKALALSSLAPSFDSMNETVEGSIALMRQFGIGAGELESALGSVNTVAAKFAVEASDIIAAIQRTGGVFATASKGVSSGTDALNEFIAVFTSVRATTRESAETIATGLRTIFTRVQRGDTINALKEFGVNLTDAQGKFVGAYKAVQLLSEGLNSIDPRDLKFSRIVEELGGFRQIGKVIPLIQQFSVAQDALAVAQQGQGSLARDAVKAQLSLANQISKVREQFFALFRELGQSQGFQTLVKGALSLSGALIKVADASKTLLPALSVMLAFKGAKALTQFAGGFNKGFRGGPDNKKGSGRSEPFADGGPVRKFARGGVVPGSGNRDTVPAMLMPGEFVIRKKAVETIGSNNLHNINKYGSGGSIRAGGSNKRQRFANGGRTPKPQNVIVDKITDGDSLRVNFTPESESYQTSSRLVGVDAYESNSGPKWMKNLGKQAQAETAAHYEINKTVTKDFIEGYEATGGKKDSRGRPFFKNDSLKTSLIDKGLGYAYTGGKKQQDISKEEYLLKFPNNKSIVNKKNLGGKIQKFAGGGQVLRNIGIIDTDVLRDAANATVVRPAMEKLGITDVSDYTTRLGELAAKARKNKSLSKFMAIAGAAGSGKSSVASGKGANDDASLRKTNRSQILTPEDIDKVNEIFILTSTASQSKLDSYLKDVDRAYILSSNNKDEQDQIRLNRDSRDTTGEGLYGRKPGTTRGAIADFALEETILRDELGKKATVLGRKKDSFGLRRKKDSELPEIIQAGGFYTGGFAPPTRGHRGALDALLDNMLSKNPKASLEDIVVSVAPDLPMIAGKEGIEHAARYGIFPADFRALLSKTNFGNAMISTQDQPPGSLPKFMEVAGSGERRRFARLKGAMAITSGKEEGVLGKYARAGIDVKDIPRIEDISATKVRDALFSGDDKILTSFLNPEVASILMGNRAQLRNRSTMVPMLIEEIQKFVDQDKARSNSEISELLASAPGGPYGNVNAKLKQNAPEIAGQIQDIRSQRDRVSRGAFGYRAFNIIRALSAKYPDTYGLDPSRRASVSAQPFDVSKDTIAAQLSESMSGEFGIGAPQTASSSLQQAILEKVSKETATSKGSGILPTKGDEILRRLGGISLPSDTMFGEFAGKKVSDTRNNKGKLPYWLSKTDHLMMKPEKEASYIAARDYLIDKFNESQGAKTVTALQDMSENVTSSKQLGLVGLNPLGHTKLTGPLTWDLGQDKTGKNISVDASMIERGLPQSYQSIIDYLSSGTEELVSGASKRLGIEPKKLSKKERETLGQGNIEGGLLEQIFGSADATILDDALRTRPIDFPMGIGAKAAKIFGIDPDIPTEVKRTINAGSRAKATKEFQRHFRQQYGIPEPSKNVVQKLSGGGILKKYGEIFPSSSSTGPFKEMVFDFDDTLVTGGEIRLPDGRLDLSRKDDMPLVQEMLKKGKLTPLGQHLSEALKQEPSLMDNIGILSARNPNQAGILAQTLQNLGLPIPASKIRGSNGPQNKKITSYQKMIDDNLDTVTRLRAEGQEAIHYKFFRGGRVEQDYRQILRSILPKEMLTDDGYLKMKSGEAEPIEFMAPDLIKQSRDEMLSILLGKERPAKQAGSAFFKGGISYKTIKHRLEQNKDKIPPEEYSALRSYVDENLLFQGNDDVISIINAKHKGVLPHETFHDIQGYLYDNHPEIMDKLFASVENHRDSIAKWYNDPDNSEWTGPKDYKLEHFFPDQTTRSPYSTNIIEDAAKTVSKKTKKPASVDSWKILGMSQQDMGRNEAIPVLLSAAAERNAGATEILSKIFADSGLNQDFHKVLPKYKDGGPIKDVWHGTTTGQDDSVLESFKKYGAKSDVSSGFGQGQGFYVYSDPTSAMVRAMELEGGANYLTAADPNGKPMALKFTELLDGKNWDLDYEFQNADIVNFIHSHYDRVKEAVAKSKGVDLGTNLKDFSLDQKYDEYLDTTDNTMMRKVGISFKDQGKDAERLLANNNYGDARSAEVLSSLVKSLMHSDPDFYEEFENSFFHNLKPKQGLKYVGKDPLKPVLAEIFTRQNNIHDTGWITEKFAKGGSPKDTVPALLTPGEFVVNKDAAQKIGYSNLHKLNKADKIQGYNKGGVVGTFQKLAGGGFADPNSFIRKFGQWFTEQPTNNQVQRFDRRPDIVGRSSTQVNKDVPKVLEDLIEGINKLGFSAAQSATVIKKLRNSSEVSYKEVEKALSGDLDKLKIAGAGFDTIVRAEETLYKIRDQGKRDVDLKRNLEGAFAQRGGSSTKLMGGKMMTGDINQGSAAAQEMIEKEAQYIISGATQKLRASGKNVDLSKITDKAYKIAASKVSGVSQKSFSDFDISGKDIKEYINESKKDRKTLIELDKEYVAQKMAELKRSSQFASVGSKQQQRMIKELEKETRREISIRRSLINDLASRTGQKGVGAIDMMDFNNSPVLKYIKSLSAPQVLGGAAIGTGLVAGQGKNIGKLLYGQQTNDAKVKSAETAAAIESSGIIISTGLATAAEILANVPGKVGIIAASVVAIGSTLYGLAEYFSDISGSQAEARRQQQSENRAVQLDAAMEKLNRSAKEYETNVGNIDLKNNLSEALRDVNNISVSDAQFQFREAKLDFPKQSAIAGMAPSKATGLQYINETLGNAIASVMPTWTGLGASRETMGASETARINAEMASKNKETGAIAQQAIMSALSQGATKEDIVSGDKYKNERAGLLMSDVKGVAAFNAAISAASSAVGGRELTEGELNEVLKKVTKDYYEQGNVILDTIIKANDLAKAMEAADRAGRQLAVSFDRMIDSINQSINRIQYESQQRTRYAQSRIKGLTGESGPPEINIPELNVLENPQAYTPADFGLAVGKAADLIGGTEGKNIESMINFSKSLPDIMTKAIADRLSGEASLTKEDASAQAISVGQGIINSSGLDDETKEKLNSQLDAYVKNASEKISDEGLASNRKVALEVFLDQIRTSSSALGEGLARKATDAAKAMLEFRQNGLNDFAKSLQQSSDYIRQSTELRRKADKIMYKANIDTREIFRDVGESYNEAKGQTLNEVAQMTGGITDPVAIGQAIKQESDRINDPNTGLLKQRDDALLEKDFNDVIQFTQDIQDSSDKIKNYNDALDKLANSTNMYERALQEAKNAAETQKDRQSFVEKLLTNTPEEADNLNQAFIRLQRNLSGGLNNPWNQRDARKAFNETLFKTGSMREAYRAGNTVLSNQRKETLGLMQDPGFKAIIKGQIQNQRVTSGQGLLSEADLDNMFRQQEGKMMQQMAIESGFANNPVVMQAIQTKMNPDSEPMAQAAANQVLEAAGLQKAATEEQSKLREVQAMELNVFAMDNLTVAIIDLKNQLADSFSRNDTIEGRDNSGAKTIKLNLGATDLGDQYQDQAAITASRGGLIYAAEGQMIDFKPKGTDTVPAMLSPGEFVINAKSTAQNLPLLEAINNGYANGGRVKYFKDGGLASLFRGFDKDNNNTLSENEFAEYFSDFDLNKDKAIDIKEFLEYGQRISSRAKLARLLDKPGTFHSKRYQQLADKAGKRTPMEENEYNNYSKILSSKSQISILKAEEIKQRKNSIRRLNLNIKGKANRTPEEETEYQTLREEQRVLNPEIRRRQESIRRMNLNIKGKANRTPEEETEYQSLRQQWTKENPTQAARAQKNAERQTRINENNRYIYQKQDQYRRQRLGLDPIEETKSSTAQSTTAGAKTVASQSRAEDNRRKQLWFKGSKGRTPEEESEYSNLRALYEKRKSKTKKTDLEADQNAAQQAAIEDANARVTGFMNRFASSMGPIQDANDYVNRWTLASTALGPVIMKQWMANNTEPFRLDKNGNISRHDYDKGENEYDYRDPSYKSGVISQAINGQFSKPTPTSATSAPLTDPQVVSPSNPRYTSQIKDYVNNVIAKSPSWPDLLADKTTSSGTVNPTTSVKATNIRYPKADGTTGDDIVDADFSKFATKDWVSLANDPNNTAAMASQIAQQKLLTMGLDKDGKPLNTSSGTLSANTTSQSVQIQQPSAPTAVQSTANQEAQITAATQQTTAVVQQPTASRVGITQESAARSQGIVERRKSALKLREKTIREYFGNDDEGRRRADKVISDLRMWDKSIAGRAPDYGAKFDAEITRMGLKRESPLVNSWDIPDMISPDEAIYRYQAEVKRREDYMKGRAAGDFDKFDPSESPTVKGVGDWLSGKNTGIPRKNGISKPLSGPVKRDTDSVNYTPPKSVKLDPITFRPLNYDEIKLEKEIQDLEKDLSWSKRDSVMAKDKPVDYLQGLINKKKATIDLINTTREEQLNQRVELNKSTEKRYQELAKASNRGLSTTDQKEYIRLSLQRGKPWSDIRAFPGDVSSVENSMRRDVFSETELKRWDARQQKQFGDALAKEKETTFYDKVASELAAIARKNTETTVSKITGNDQLGQAAGLMAGFTTSLGTGIANPSTVAVGVGTAGFGPMGAIGLQGTVGTTAAGLQYRAGDEEGAIQTLKDTAITAALNLALRAATSPKTWKILEQAKKEFAEGIADPPSLKEFLNDPEMRELGKSLGYTDLLETVRAGQAVDTQSMFPNTERSIKGLGKAIEKMPQGGAMKGTEYGFGGGNRTELNARAARAMQPEMLDLKPGTTTYSGPQTLTPKGEALVASRIQALAKSTPVKINPKITGRGFFAADALGSITGNTTLKSPSDTFASLHEQHHAVSRILGILDQDQLLTKGVISKLPKNLRPLAENAGSRISAIDEYSKARITTRGTNTQVPKDIALRNALARTQEEALVAKSLGQKPLENPSYVTELAKYNSLLNKDPTTPPPTAPKPKSSTTNLIKTGAALAGGTQLISSGIKASTSPKKEQTKTKKPTRKANGGLIYAENGQLIDFSPKGTDTVPAMLTPGEFVVNAKSTKENLGLLHSINKSKGGKISYFADGGQPKPSDQVETVAPSSTPYGGEITPAEFDQARSPSSSFMSNDSTAQMQAVQRQYEDNQFLTDSTVPSQIEIPKVNDPILAFGEQGVRAVGGIPSAIGGAAQYGIGAIGETAIRATHIGRNAITSDDEKNPSMLKDFMDYKNAGAERAKLGLANAAAGMANMTTLNTSSAVKDYWDPITHSLENNISNLQKGREESSRRIGENIDSYTSSILPENTFANIMEKSVGVADVVGAEVMGGLAFDAGLSKVATATDAVNSAKVAKGITTGEISPQLMGNLDRNTRAAIPGLTKENMTVSSVRQGVNADGTLVDWTQSLVTDPTLSARSLQGGKDGMGFAYEGLASEMPTGLDTARTTFSTAQDGTETAKAMGNLGRGHYSTTAGESPAIAGIQSYMQDNLKMAGSTGGGANTRVLVGKLTDEAVAGLSTIDHASMSSYASKVQELRTQGINDQLAELMAENQLFGNSPGKIGSSSLIELPSQQSVASMRGPGTFSRTSSARSAETMTVAVTDPGAYSQIASLSAQEALAFPSEIKKLHSTIDPALKAKDPFTLNHELSHLPSHNDKHNASYHNSGGLIYANNGALVGASGTDTVPAMLTPGEFVVNRESSQKHIPLLNAINSGHFNRGGIVNYLANGGVVAPKYYAGGGQQLSNAVKQAPGVSNNSSNFGDIESALSKIVQSMSTSLEDKISQINQLNQNMTGFIDNFGSKSQSLVDGLQNSTTSLGSYADKLSNVSLPDTITFNGNVTSEHRFNGAEAANRVLDTLGPTMEQQTNNQLNGAFNKMNKGPGQLDSGIFGPDTTSIMGKSIK